MTQTGIVNTFKQDVLFGLSQEQKILSSKYFYDEKGDKLFQQIMGLDEYYLTRKEFEIFDTHKQVILQSLYNNEPFRIIELGAGDGYKTKVLLKYFVDQGAKFTYTPVDISDNVLEILEKNVIKEIPQLHFEAFHGQYFEALEMLATKPEKDVVFFLGSNIGNFEGQTAIPFFSKLREYLKKGDQLFLGVDLKKEPSNILAAYHDKEGVTEEFNLNLLDSINRELDGTFDRKKFQHYPYYNPQTGECRSYLICNEEHTINVASETFHFRKWEAIYMEVSKKYDESQLEELAKASGFTRSQKFYDKDGWFTNQVWNNL